MSLEDIIYAHPVPSVAVAATGVLLLWLGARAIVNNHKANKAMDKEQAEIFASIPEPTPWIPFAEKKKGPALIIEFPPSRGPSA